MGQVITASLWPQTGNTQGAEGEWETGMGQEDRGGGHGYSRWEVVVAGLGLLKMQATGFPVGLDTV